MAAVMEIIVCVLIAVIVIFAIAIWYFKKITEETKRDLKTTKLKVEELEKDAEELEKLSGETNRKIIDLAKKVGQMHLEGLIECK